MKKQVSQLAACFIASLFSISSFAATAPLTSSVKPMQAVQIDCSNSSIDLGAKESYGSETIGSNDKDFNSAGGVFVLEPKEETVQAYNQLKFTVWSKKQTVDLGYGYSMVLNLSYQEQKVVGDFLVKAPALTVTSALVFKNAAIDIASVQSQDENAQNIQVALDNLPLRLALGAGQSPETDLSTLLNNAPNMSELLTTFGDGTTLVTSVNLQCKKTAK